MKILITIIAIILSLQLVLAINVIAGNSYSFESEQFDFYEVVGNSSNLEGMTIDWLNGITIISFDPLFKPDNFTLVFWKDKEPIIEYHSGGGGTKTVYKDRNITKYEFLEREYGNNIEYIDILGETITIKEKFPIWILFLYFISGGAIGAWIMGMIYQKFFKKDK